MQERRGVTVPRNARKDFWKCSRTLQNSANNRWTASSWLSTLIGRLERCAEDEDRQLAEGEKAGVPTIQT
jgi:hypothetical protein